MYLMFAKILRRWQMKTGIKNKLLRATEPFTQINQNSNSGLHDRK